MVYFASKAPSLSIGINYHQKKNNGLERKFQMNYGYIIQKNIRLLSQAIGYYSYQNPN